MGRRHGRRACDNDPLRRGIESRRRGTVLRENLLISLV